MPRVTPRPVTAEDQAPYLFVNFVKSPHTKGPKKAAQIAPQETPSIETIVDGFISAIITDNIIKNTLPSLIRTVNLASLAFLFIKPA